MTGLCNKVQEAKGKVQDLSRTSGKAIHNPFTHSLVFSIPHAAKVKKHTTGDFHFGASDLMGF